ncbi:citrate synthase/methylcitrate synthase [Aestuariispira ectoiniformans]|uniref:citrate synthase/methylcitrate synthase n=1 Tax=Aestuariispira ectoiniformans TaxID=2775080 RepID=UPI00223A9FDC|nr:citrate synthase/methylcitrate synthase [Aestuariispira ectoiniformans]
MVDAGLENVVAAETRLSAPNGQKGELIIAGYDVADLAPNASYEQVISLLWNGRLPTVAELEEIKTELAGHRVLPEITLRLLEDAAKVKLDPMTALRMATDTLALAIDTDGELKEVGAQIVSAIPTIVASYFRLYNGKPVVAPRTDLGHIANFIYMLSGEEPQESTVHALATYFNVSVDHGLNASTFASRVIISTQSDLLSAIVGGIGALKGPLHGGAPGPALDMVIEIGKPENAEAFIREKLEKKERIMGFGHRVYKTYDPRARTLDKAVNLLYSHSGNKELYDLAKEVERVTLELLKEYKPDLKLETNIEFYTALLLNGIGLTPEFFAPTFAAARVVGWIGNCLEQTETGRLIRPKADYIGPRNLKWADEAA